MYPRFTNDIVRMNAMYELKDIGPQWLAQTERIDNFRKILQEECNEIVEIKEVLAIAGDDNWPAIRMDARVVLADLLGDIIVYCASEAERWNIPLAQVLDTIMQSNFSKLGADGRPIKDERGKFLKGPNYWKPEPKIRELLESIEQFQQEQLHEKVVDLNMSNIVEAALAPKEPPL